MARIEGKEAWDQIRDAKDEAKDTKLELMHAKKYFEDKLAKARAQVVEGYTKFEESRTLLGSTVLAPTIMLK